MKRYMRLIAKSLFILLFASGCGFPITQNLSNFKHFSVECVEFISSCLPFEKVNKVNIQQTDDGDYLLEIAILRETERIDGDCTGYSGPVAFDPLPYICFEIVEEPQRTLTEQEVVDLLNLFSQVRIGIGKTLCLFPFEPGSITQFTWDETVATDFQCLESPLPEEEVTRILEFLESLSTTLSEVP